MIIKKHEIESLFKGIEKVRDFYAKKHNIHASKVNFVIQGHYIYVMIDKVHKETINKIEELKSV